MGNSVSKKSSASQDSAGANSNRRRGLRLKFRNVDPEVKSAIKNYAVWLRGRFQFPMRVPAYVSGRRQVMTFDGERVSASFFAPYDRDVEPFIRLATGDYPELIAEFGEFSVKAMILCSLTHEVLHYEQWCRDGTTSERGVVVRARNIVQRYIDETESF